MSTYIGIATSGTVTGISGYNIVRVGLNMQNALSGFGWEREINAYNQTLWSSNIPQVASGLMPTGASNHQIWKMTDSLSGSFPVFLKWGMGLNSNNLITHEFQAGTGCDNATSNLMGATTKFSLTNATTQDGANGPSLSYFAGDSGRFSCALNSEVVTAVGRFFSIERSVDSSGVNTDSYITLCGAANNTIAVQQSLLKNGTASILMNTKWMTLLMADATKANSFNGNVLMSPVFPILGYIGNPSKNIGVTKLSSMTNANTFIGNIYNTDFTYMGFNGNICFQSADGDTTNRPTTIFMRWE